MQFTHNKMHRFQVHSVMDFDIYIYTPCNYQQKHLIGHFHNHQKFSWAPFQPIPIPSQTLSDFCHHSLAVPVLGHDGTFGMYSFLSGFSPPTRHLWDSLTLLHVATVLSFCVWLSTNHIPSLSFNAFIWYMMGLEYGTAKASSILIFSNCMTSRFRFFYFIIISSWLKSGYKIIPLWCLLVYCLVAQELSRAL